MLLEEQQGVNFFNSGDFGRAVVCFSKALQQDYRNPRLLFALGTSFQKLAEHDLALKSLNAAIALDPHNAAAHNNRGLSLMSIGQHQDAAVSFEKAIALEPTLFEAYGNLGNALRTAGRLEDALGAFEAAIRLRPDSADTHRSHLLTQLYNPEVGNTALFNAQQAIAEKFAKPFVRQTVHFNNTRDRNRKLKIGYLSSDFRDHPVGHNLAPLFFNHDKSRFETFLYAEVSTVDELTVKYKDAADHWRPTPGLNDEEVVRQIRKDAIDILVFLAGSLDANRQLIAARRAAPIQVSLHDAASSGLETMDYWISDRFCHPTSTTELFTERLVRIPNLLAYDDISNSPEVAPPPCRKNGHMTFGSLNNPAKLNRQVTDLISRVLQAAPTSKLLMKYMNTFASKSVRAFFLERFESQGVSPDRIVFQSSNETRFDHLKRYADIDIALDAFPFNGVTTSFEALWMGVPVITLVGERFIARAAGSILHTIDARDGVALDEEAYVQAAVDLSSNHNELEEIRCSLRQRMKQSPLMDGSQYARNLERVLVAMWHMWCDEQR